MAIGDESDALRAKPRRGNPGEILQPGEVLAEHFEIIRMLGFGGMGVVYEALDRVSGERVALKCIKRQANARSQSNVRFIEEINTARKLRHPNIVAVFDVAQESDMLFFTMEYLDGVSLRIHLNERGPLGLREVVRIMRPLCLALEYAHRYMVHRDLSPDNVFLLRDGGVKLLDFGLARDISRETMTMSGARLGKAQYMSPEQRTDAAHVDARADIYALGVMFFELLSGQLPLGYARLSDHVPALAGACDQLVAAALAPLERRFQSVAEFRIALEACAAPAKDPPTARNAHARASAPATRPESPLQLEAVPRFPSRNAIAGLLTTGLALCAVITWGVIRLAPQSPEPVMQAPQSPEPVIQAPKITERISQIPQARIIRRLGSKQMASPENPSGPLDGYWYELNKEGRAGWGLRIHTSDHAPAFKLTGSDVTIEGVIDSPMVPGSGTLDLNVRRAYNAHLVATFDPILLTMKCAFELKHELLTIALNAPTMDYYRQVSMYEDSMSSDGRMHYNTAKEPPHEFEDGKRPSSIHASENVLVLRLERVQRTYAPSNLLEVAWEETEHEARLQLPGGNTVEMIWIPAGSFLMGSKRQLGDELLPLHRVTLTKGYWLGKYELTQAQWNSLMTVNPSNYRQDSLPVERITWENAMAFVDRLNDVSEKQFRLPTEAEWEYACRAGLKTPGRLLPDGVRVGDYAWHRKNSGGSPHEGGAKQPNAWGLFDMTGNVWEWCSDRYSTLYHPTEAQIDPQGPIGGLERVAMGGCSYLDDPSGNCNEPKRNSLLPNKPADAIGMRLCAD